MSVRKVRVLIVDDSATARLGIKAALRPAPGIEVVAEAGTVEEAVAAAERMRPDLITMDVYLQSGDGMDATDQIMRRVPTPILVVTAANHRDPRLAYNAMAVGALDIVAKPPGPASPEYEERCRKLRRLVLALSQVPVVRRRFGARSLRPRPPSSGAAEPPVAPTSSVPRSKRSGAPRLIAIAGSTGGPPVVRELLVALPPSFVVPIAIVQHIMSGFGKGFARWLELETRRRIVVVDTPVRPEDGTVYLPEDDHHLEVTGRGWLTSSRSEPVNFHRPSADILFESALRAHADRVVGVLLTGMGDDGARGLKALRAAGCECLVQSPDTCAVGSMPEAAIALGAATRVLEPAELASALVRIVEIP